MSFIKTPTQISECVVDAATFMLAVIGFSFPSAIQQDEQKEHAKEQRCGHPVSLRDEATNRTKLYVCLTFL